MTLSFEREDGSLFARASRERGLSMWTPLSSKLPASRWKTEARARFFFLLLLYVDAAAGASDSSRVASRNRIAPASRGDFFVAIRKRWSGKLSNVETSVCQQVTFFPSVCHESVSL